MTDASGSRAPLAGGVPGARLRAVSVARWMRTGQTLITAVLLAVGATRAVVDGTSAAWVVAASVVFAGWYGAGLLLFGRAAHSGGQTGTAVDPAVPAPPAWWIIGLAAIWVGAVVVSAEFVWLAFPLWLFAGYALRLRWAVAYSAAVFAIVVAAPVLHNGALTYADVIGPLVGGVFALGISRGFLQLVRDARERQRLVESLVETQHEMAGLQDELARTQRESGAMAERTRLSRDIHDTVAQSLTSIGMLARSAQEAARTDAVGPISARGRKVASMPLAQIERLSHEALADVRRIVAALAPAELETGALAGALARMLERLADETGIATELHVDETLPALPTATEVALLRTAQSALANVRAHAAARRVVVNLVDAEEAVRLDIVDDGAGFDAAAWDAARDITDGGYGLRAMRDRLRELGGGLEVESAPGDGTALSAHVPFGLMPTGEAS
ncbi:sensor histidine kinase [Microbacterium allomyrinae]|uniref:Sensor histidine kinase n=1 Tax=Microbacterium allomyrinae TaxID=2830666 RepID=A0A9X1LXM9_9MICO|nr:sensor histidine kinase [Microbacterium allomyrinae]MCC2033737.1 sensor histidine kinase [Microbacterium allomyrinae]